MGWEQRFGALIELAGDEWDAAGGAGMPRRGRSGLATRHSSKPIATTGTPGGRLRKTLSLAKSHPDCPNRASPQRTFPHGTKPSEIASE